MIQRMQTLWMALASAAMFAVLFMPSVCFSADGDTVKLHSYGIRILPAQEITSPENGKTECLLQTWALSVSTGAVIAAAALVPLAAIFFFRKRKTQIKMLAVEFILIACSAAMLGWLIYFTHKVAAPMSDDYRFLAWPLLVLAAAPANWFALRGVMRDEALVRSVDRIR